MTAATPDAPDTPEPAEPSAIRRYALRAGIAIVAAVLVAGVVLTDDEDPIVFGIPMIVVATLLIVAITLSDRRKDARGLERAARETGLEYDGVRPVPAITSILRDDHAPAHMLSGDLEQYGPEVRIARLPRRLVAIVNLSEEPAAAAGLDADAAVAAGAAHPLKPDVAIEDETLVVAVARDTPPRQLLELTRTLVARV